MQYPVYFDIYEELNALKGDSLEQPHHTNDGDDVLSMQTREQSAGTVNYLSSYPNFGLYWKP